MTEIEQLRKALTDMAYGYLRIQEIGPQSAFAARAFKAARELVDIDTSKAWVSEHELTQLADGHDCVRRAIDTGQAVRIGAVRASKGSFVPDNPDLHYAGPVYRLVTESETDDG